MKTTPHPNGYTITGIADDVPESDVYTTRAAADSDRLGMQRFIRADRKDDTEFIHGEQADEPHRS